MQPRLPTTVMTTVERDCADDLLDRAFVEDLGGRGDAALDLTAVALAGARVRANLVAREAGVVCGVRIAADAFQRRGSSDVAQCIDDGERVAAEDVLLTVEGAADAVLSAERTALNVLQRLSGTATLTRAFVDAVAPHPTRILDTRKTMPGIRALQRWAVRCGGGYNHRFGLYDEAMIKDNHIVACGGIVPAVERIRAAHPQARIHVEADRVDQVRDAIEAGADVVLLDNMSLEELRESVRIVGADALTEASGGVTLATVGEIAATGVDRISIGALTHSARAFDAALDAVVA